MGKICTHCGGTLQEDARFCTMCGQAVEQTEPPTPEQMDEGTKPEPEMATLPAVPDPVKDTGTTAGTDTAQAQPEGAADPRTQRKEKRRKLCRRIETISIVLVILFYFAYQVDMFGVIVRTGTMNAYPEVTIGHAFAERFTDRHWDKEKVDRYAHHIVFRGRDPQTDSRWKVYFEVEKEDFFLHHIELNGQMVTSGDDISLLMQYIYTGDLSVLKSNTEEDLMDAWLNSLIAAALLS